MHQLIKYYQKQCTAYIYSRTDPTKTIK